MALTNCNGAPVKLYTKASEPDVELNVDFTNPKNLYSEACGFQLLLLIPININDRHMRAYNILQNSAGREFISDIEIVETWTYAFVGTLYCTQLKGKSYPFLSNNNSESESSSGTENLKQKKKTK